MVQLSHREHGLTNLVHSSVGIIEKIQTFFKFELLKLTHEGYVTKDHKKTFIWL